MTFGKKGQTLLYKLEENGCGGLTKQAQDCIIHFLKVDAER